jgi:hypothetical protein
MNTQTVNLVNRDGWTRGIERRERFRRLTVGLPFGYQRAQSDAQCLRASCKGGKEILMGNSETSYEGEARSFELMASALLSNILTSLRKTILPDLAHEWSPEDRLSILQHSSEIRQVVDQLRFGSTLIYDSGCKCQKVRELYLRMMDLESEAREHYIAVDKRHSGNFIPMAKRLEARIAELRNSLAEAETKGIVRES